MTAQLAGYGAGFSVVVDKSQSRCERGWGETWLGTQQQLSLAEVSSHCIGWNTGGAIRILVGH